jgi:hypothetical protein
MAKITWKGEGASPPPQLEWRGVTFPLNQPVDVDDPDIIAKAKTTSIFKVEEAPEGADEHPRESGDQDDDDDDKDDDDDGPAPAEAGDDAPHRPPRRHVTARAHHSRKKK